MAEAKICGITDARALDAAIDGGARFVGFVVYPKSPRHLSRDKLAALAERARGQVETVVVTVDADEELLAAVAACAGPDWIQLHGSENPGKTAQARQYAQRGLIKAIGVARPEDLAQAAAFEPVADMLMFDAKPPPGGLPGGNALAFDWQILAGRRFGRPWMLSGGLTPANVAEAVSASGAAAVDVSSGVEASAGLKDPLKIAEFLAAARSA
ncbi:phosphoribosylanthranilate isomerase [Candidatus Viadribacter manganicus]|uniref:N-(5'-phosphoribosyl)anthranilate isomerase n=1 Tax=Candidatus Viadribacter manganicus TaxID=1759059 RepID=A0A1B1AJC3_9PROT|nr:phosphoribosylanthranilate isomerase [Candidatus Viadribacter manganicus]ANP46662.1 N-(5'-phosphoribosyl)anthranilate isomerase [Candidatus Viadribacter manganicus]